MSNQTWVGREWLDRGNVALDDRALRALILENQPDRDARRSHVVALADDARWGAI